MKERVTISVETEALARVRSEVKAGTAPNLSAAIERALRESSISQALREALALSDAIHGPVDKEVGEWGQRELERAFRETSSSTPEQ
ncbi:MAG TPA: ribbon-helix-helix protein, CopG family [Solirubrobacterales bacterium]|nr:ribbon-helix-helix protein, CopG family [Solirubrobacterales bacterium]